MDRSLEQKPLMEESCDMLQYGEFHPPSSRRWVIAALRKVVAETVGTFFLMMAACGSIMAGWDILGQALAVAFCLVMLISSLGPLSGAHFNPAITLSFAATKQFRPWSQVPLYIGAQLVGGCVAMGLAKQLYDAGKDVALTQPSGAWGPAFTMEVVLTIALAFIATATNTQPNFVGIQGAIAVGFTVAMNMLLGGELSGASMNPMRSLAPAIIQNNYNGIWIYLFAPVIGALMGSFLYKLIHVNVFQDYICNAS